MRPPRPKPRPRPSRLGSWGPAGVLVRDPYSSISEPFPIDSTSSAPGTETVRWAQDCLNHAMGLRLAVNGVMGVDTRSALRRFQGQQGLRVSGILGPDTQGALTGACKGELSPEFARKDITDELKTDRPIHAAEDKEGFSDIFGRIDSEHDQEINKVNGPDDARIIDMTAKADKSVRKGTRDPKKVYALVLHQMACCFKPKDPLKRFLSLGAHFAILADGRILQLHPISALVWASNGFNNRSVAVEFAGNFPSIRGKWWKGDTYGRNYPTQAQIEAGRTLVRYLINKIGLTHILAHRQSSGTRENDPGPDIWHGVGQWAVENLGLKDGGPGFKIGTGNPIPDAWRTRSGIKHETNTDFEMEFDDSELFEQGEEPDGNTRDQVRAVQRSLNKVMGLRLFVDGMGGSATRSAIRSFQKRQGLPISGIVDQDTEKVLRTRQQREGSEWKI
jgi:hypothetical protein